MAKEERIENKPEVIDTSARWSAPWGSHYTESVGYGDEDIQGYEGRMVWGATIGILQMHGKLPMIPGEVGNMTTFKFPIVMQSTGPVNWDWILGTEPHPEMSKCAINAARKLELQGARAIVGNCGFWATYQDVVAEAINVPFFSSSLLQVPMVIRSVGRKKKVGVLTADGESLENAPALENAGVSDRSQVVIWGMKHDPEMQKILSDATSYNPLGLEKALVTSAKEMLAKHPDIGAIVCECTSFPAHAHAIQEAVRLDVWDAYTLVNWMFSGTMRRPITGWM